MGRGGSVTTERAVRECPWEEKPRQQCVPGVREEGLQGMAVGGRVAEGGFLGRGESQYKDLEPGATLLCQRIGAGH